MRESLKQIFLSIYEFHMKIYLPIYARPIFQKINLLKYQTALRSLGYNNCCDPRKTGELNFIELFAKTKPTFCLDIGANIGKYSKLLLENTESKILAFEPLPGAYALLEKLKTEYPGRFSAENVGVGDATKKMILNYGSDTSELSSFSTDINAISYVGKSNIHQIEVEVVTLDDYFAETQFENMGEIDLMKIDTEGFEYEVLQGAVKTISILSPKFIQIELNSHQLHRGHSLFEFSKILNNYDVFQLLPFGKGGIKRDPASSEANIFAYSNFVFVRRDLQFNF
jgi:FkbM family methyltransferase